MPNEEPIQQPSLPPIVDKNKSFFTIENCKTIAIIILICLALPGSYAYQKTKTELLTEQSKNIELNKQITTHSSLETISVPVLLGKTVAYKTIIKQMDNSTLNLTKDSSSFSLTDKTKQTTTIKTTFSLGPALSTKGGWGIGGSADILSLGIGTLRFNVMGSTSEQWFSPQLNIYF